MKKFLCPIVIVVFLFVLSGCASTRGYQGAGVGAAVGGIAGALIDNKNPWRGAIIGGALGAFAGGALTEMAEMAAREAAVSGKPVAYKSEDGTKFVRADPAGYNARTDCQKTRVRQWEDGRLLTDEIKEVCDSKKNTNKY